MANLGLGILSHDKSPTKASYADQEPIEYQDDHDCLLVNQLLTDYGPGSQRKRTGKVQILQD